MVKIEIADIIFDISHDLIEQSVRIEDEYNDFFSNGDPDVFIRGHYSVKPDISLRNEDKVFESSTFWNVYKVNKQFIFTMKVPQDFSPYCIGIFQEDFRQGDIYNLIPNSGNTYHGPPPHPLAFPLFHLLMTSFLAQGHGLHIHACGIDDNGRGLLFSGSSTHGKTTMARLWQGEAAILNDERIIIRQKDGQLWIYGTPWHGELDDYSPAGAPLERIFFLRKTEKNTISHLESSEAATMLLSHCFLPMWDEKGMNFVVDFSHQIVSNVPCCILGFTPDKNIVEFLRR